MANFADVPIEELVALAAGLGIAGLLAGTVAGLLGVGGGIVLVPVLYQTLGILGVDESLRMPLAVGTSLATIIPTSIRSTLSHNAKGAVDWDVLKRWALPTIIGVGLGTWLASIVGGKGMTAVFAGGAASLGLFMLFGREEWRLGDRLPSGIGSWLLGLANGCLSVMMGIGGGTFGVTVMTLYGTTIHRAVATAAGFGLIIGVPGTLGMIVNGWHATGLPPFSLGYVNLVGLALIVPATIVAAPWGVAIAHRLSRGTLRLAFGAFLCLTAVRMGWALFG
ncbi:MAG: sulfite exporter TauE/SafE family protein [Alphaproteobacteria bacterium]|nr:sulfite exporter TauE/SafE family protein [Alphaproteobacteria bacterium]